MGLFFFAMLLKYYTSYTISSYLFNPPFLVLYYDCDVKYKEVAL